MIVTAVLTPGLRVFGAVHAYLSLIEFWVTTMVVPQGVPELDTRLAAAPGVCRNCWTVAASGLDRNEMGQRAVVPVSVHATEEVRTSRTEERGMPRACAIAARSATASAAG